MFQHRTSTLSHQMPNSTSRIWSRRQLQDHHLARTHQAPHQLNRMFQLLVTTRPSHSSMTSPVRARIVQRVAVDDPVDENGEVKSRRRTLRLSAKEASIMDIEV